jgi:hypothetical protein
METFHYTPEKQEFSLEQKEMLRKAAAFLSASESILNQEWDQRAKDIRSSFERSYNYNTPEQRAEGIFDETEYEVDEKEAEIAMYEDGRLGWLDYYSQYAYRLGQDFRSAKPKDDYYGDIEWEKARTFAALEDKRQEIISEHEPDPIKDLVAEAFPNR